MVAKMTAQQKIPVDEDSDGAASQLSALVDEELADREIELVLRRLLRDGQPRGQWERYHLISEAMQGHLPDAFDAGFAARIRQAIEAEPALKPAGGPPTWYKPIAGFGLAASVVVVALFGFRSPQDSASNPTVASTEAPARNGSAMPSAFISRVATEGQRPDQGNALVESRLNNYWVNHNNYASFNAVNGMLPYVRMVGHQSDR
ncbi:MAG: sigma-E factor negative regulatory protein [Candidatus Competibacter sp.]|nr:sigma-E factor negative regulatory protein [Candidatus Competibacter sp.]